MKFEDYEDNDGVRFFDRDGDQLRLELFNDEGHELWIHTRPQGFVLTEEDVDQLMIALLTMKAKMSRRG